MKRHEVGAAAGGAEFTAEGVVVDDGIERILVEGGFEEAGDVAEAVLADEEVVVGGIGGRGGQAGISDGGIDAVECHEQAAHAAAGLP